MPAYSYNALLKKAADYLESKDIDLLKQSYKFVNDLSSSSGKNDYKLESGSKPLFMAHILVDCHVDAITLAATLLHGVVIDGGCSIQSIETKLGNELARVLQGCFTLSGVQYKEDMGDQEVEALQRMIFVMAQDIRVIIIKLAERLYLLRNSAKLPQKEQHALAKEAFEVYVPLSDLLGIWNLKSQLEDLCFEQLFPKEYSMLDEQMRKHAKAGEKFIQKMIQKTVKACGKNKIKVQIEGRMKHLYGIFKKMLRDKREMNQVHDIYALRVIVDDVPSCYDVLGVIHALYPPKVGRIKDYIAVPKDNNYQSLHTTVVGESDTVIEFQIRTQEMHNEAQFGVASHFVYKSQQRNVSPWMKDILELLKRYHDRKSFYKDFGTTKALNDRILVFTDTGNIIDLPVHATVLDFAYNLGPQYGHCFQHAKVNGKKVGITTQLHTGDTVQVAIDMSLCPQREWLNFVVTDKAKQSLIEFFRHETREKKLLLGMQILERELQIVSKKTLEDLSRKEKQRIANKFQYVSFEEVLTALAEGVVRPEQVGNYLHSEQYFFQVLRNRVKRWWHSWRGKTENIFYPITISVVSEDRFGLLHDVLAVFAKEKLNISSVHADRKFFWSEKYSNRIRFSVKDFDQYYRIVEKIKKVDSVLQVVQSYSRGRIIFYIGAFISVLFWVMRPVIMYLSEDPTAHTLLSGASLYVGIVLLFFLIYQLKTVLRRQLIIEEEAKYIWFTLFVLNSIALFTIVGEILFFRPDINWIMVLGFIIVIYAQLTLDYIYIQKYSSINK